MGVKISNLPAIVTPGLTDIFPVVQSGVTYKETFTQLSSLFATSGVNNNITSMTGLTGYLQAPLGVKDANGNIVVAYASAVSAENYLAFSNNASPSDPGIVAKGLDSDVGISYVAKGLRGHSFYSESGSVVSFTSGVGYVHGTLFSFPTTAAVRTVTWPDTDGTVYLSKKANGTEAANAVTASGTSGVITTSSLTTAGGATYVITWTNTFITTSSIIQLTIMGGTNTTQNITLTSTAGSGTSTLTIYNNTAATALNGTILIGYMVIP